MGRRTTSREKSTGYILAWLLLSVFCLSAVATPEGVKDTGLVLTNEKGENVRLAEVVDSKATLLYFWATWCKPCRKIEKSVSAFARKYKDQIQVLGINVGGVDSPEDVRQYRQRYRIAYPLLLDRNNETVEFYRIFAIPDFILLDRMGEIHYRGTTPPAKPEGVL
ncbi:MAG: TlpA family protein disulfide reductase [Deltaproteobacteria bacterium]|nr:MAG: TlpA family protein disulfide reductase [Deltaproteobacteria bacterium]